MAWNSEKYSCAWKDHFHDVDRWRHLKEINDLLFNQKWPRLSKDLKKSFYDEYYNKTIGNVRLLLLLLLFFYGIFELSFRLAFPNLITQFTGNMIVNCLIVALPVAVIGFIIILSFFNIFKRFMFAFISLAMICAGFRLILEYIFCSNSQVELTFIYSNLILLTLVIYTVAQLNLRYAAFTGMLLFIAYEATPIFKGHAIHTREQAIMFAMTSFILICTNFIGWVACYWTEVHHRRNFLQKLIIEEEQKKSENLLLNILPKEIASILKNEYRLVSDHFDSVSILFADVVNFTALSSGMTPSRIVELLNEIFSYFDELVEIYGVEKIKTIGDCYMAASGIPTPRTDHVPIIVELAVKMNQYVSERTFQDGIKIHLRIGINSGPVVAGVIGRNKFIYDLWGDTVNLASRMESHGSKGKIQITRSVYENIKDKYHCVSQGTIDVKGKGEIEVWHIDGMVCSNGH